jgi:hypothetical protein
MQISLKQYEIEAALSGYIAKQGIDLTDKSVTVTFTAGRKGGGLSADVNIRKNVAVTHNIPQGAIHRATNEPEEVNPVVLAEPEAGETKTVSLFT